MDEAVTTVKKTTRTRKTPSIQTDPAQSSNPSVSDPLVTPQALLSQSFDDLMTKVVQSKQEYDIVQRQISETKEGWAREQKQHEVEISQQKAQEELERKREQETYDYSTSLSRKRAEDEFQDKKLSWEKELIQKKEELQSQKQELESLRKLVDGFENQKDQAVKEAESSVEKRLIEQFEAEIRFKEQEFKSEKEVSGLKISNLEEENSRLTKEMEILKRSLDEATRQVKEIAVKVIESGGNQTKSQISDNAS